MCVCVVFCVVFCAAHTHRTKSSHCAAQCATGVRLNTGEVRATKHVGDVILIDPRPKIGVVDRRCCRRQHRHQGRCLSLTRMRHHKPCDAQRIEQPLRGNNFPQVHLCQSAVHLCARVRVVPGHDRRRGGAVAARQCSGSTQPSALALDSVVDNCIASDAAACIYWRQRCADNVNCSACLAVMVNGRRQLE